MFLADSWFLGAKSSSRWRETHMYCTYYTHGCSIFGSRFGCSWHATRRLFFSKCLHTFSYTNVIILLAIALHHIKRMQAVHRTVTTISSIMLHPSSSPSSHLRCSSGPNSSAVFAETPRRPQDIPRVAGSMPVSLHSTRIVSRRRVCS